MNENGIPGVFLANLHCECQELKPKVETNTSFLVRHPFSGVDSVKTVGSHLKLSPQTGPAIWPHDTGQQIPCRGTCQLTIT